MMSERKSRRNFSPENERKFTQMPSTSAHASTRITIEQKVSSAKKGPLSIECSVDPKDVVIKRRFGEGSKPLFSRDDIIINLNHKISTTPGRRRKKSSSDSRVKHNKPTVNMCRHKCPSPKEPKTPDKIPYFIDANREAERLRAKYGRRRSCHRSPINQSSKSSTTATRRGRRKSSSSEKSHSPKGRKTPDKIPYFIDAKREEDRLRAKYGRSHGSHKTRSRSPPRRRSRTRSRSPRRIRPRSRRRSRPRYRSRSRSRSRRRHRSYDRSRRSLSRNRHRDRSSSRDRSRRRSPYPEQRYMPVGIPMEYPYTSGWMAPSVPGYNQSPYMLSPQIPFHPLRPPFAPMCFPMRPPRFPGGPPRPYRPGALLNCPKYGN